MWMLTGHKDDQSRQRSSFMCRGLFYLFIRAKALSTSATLPPARAWWLRGHLLSRHFFFKWVDDSQTSSRRQRGVWKEARENPPCALQHLARAGNLVAIDWLSFCRAMLLLQGSHLPCRPTGRPSRAIPFLLGITTAISQEHGPATSLRR